MHPTKRRLNHLDMLLKLRRIKAYYNSITVDDLWLPPEANWRQFRFFVYDRRAKLVRVQKIKDIINTKEKITEALAKAYSTARLLQYEQMDATAKCWTRPPF